LAQSRRAALRLTERAGVSLSATREAMVDSLLTVVAPAGWRARATDCLA